MAIFTSYDMKGEKLSFANWISNLSPVDTYFVSVTGKEAVQNKVFHWQTDSLAAVNLSNAQKESDDAVAGDLKATTEHSNVTQILRKAVEVSDTADATDNYGRQKELAYQMEKAGKELKRDLEAILLSAQAKDDGTKNANPRKTACFQSLVAGKDAADTDTKAVVHKETAANKLTETELFDITYNLFLSGSSANTIMFHPKQAAFFSSLMDSADKGQIKMIENLQTELNKFISTLTDPLGQRFSLVPNRFMPEDAVYIFNPSDWDQMVLRAPVKTKLAKTGSSEKHMIEMEVGLRHRNPYASGILKIKA